MSTAPPPPVNSKTTSKGPGTWNQISEGREWDDLLKQFTGQGRNLSDKATANVYAPTAFSKEAAATKHSITKIEMEAAMRRLFDGNKIYVDSYGRPSRPYTRLALR